uniref:Cadherin domain-containing protein n=1 Tax=Macrostomum lignano TaxID=282301 RepID=A0A1I8FLM7_9PLAT
LRPGQPSLSSTATLSATVQRLDRSVPRFDSTFYNASLPDNLAPGTPVFDIPASSTGLAPVGTANGAFVIQQPGRVSTTNRLLGSLPARAGDSVGNEAFNNAAAVACWPQQGRLSQDPAQPHLAQEQRPALPEAADPDLRFQHHRRDDGRTVQYSIDTLLDWLLFGRSSSWTAAADSCTLKVKLDKGERGQLQHCLVVKATLPAAQPAGAGGRLAAARQRFATLTLAADDVNDNPPAFSVTSPTGVGLVIGSPVNSLVYTLQVSGQLRHKVIFSSAGSAAALQAHRRGFCNRLGSAAAGADCWYCAGQIRPARVSLIRTNLSGLLGADLRIEKFEERRQRIGSEARWTAAKTDAYLVRLQPERTGALLTQADLRARIEAKRAEIVAFFASLAPHSTASVRRRTRRRQRYDKQRRHRLRAVLAVRSGRRSGASGSWPPAGTAKASSRASGLKANGSTTAAAAPGPLAAMYQANNPANRDSDSVVGKQPGADEDGNPIIIVNSGQQQDEMLEDAWLAAATNREPSDAAAASPVDASAAVRHGDSPAMQIPRAIGAGGSALPPLTRQAAEAAAAHTVAAGPVQSDVVCGGGGDGNSWDLSASSITDAGPSFPMRRARLQLRQSAGGRP